MKMAGFTFFSMAGRRKKPQISKDLADDTKRAAPLPPMPAEAPPMPEYFREFPSLTQVWVEVVTDMDRIGILAKTDGGTVEAYCITLERMRRLLPKVMRAGDSFEAKTKTGTRVFKNPDVDTLMKTIQQFKVLAIELGATPASRGKVPNLNQADLFGRGNKQGGNSWDNFRH